MTDKPKPCEPGAKNMTGAHKTEAGRIKKICFFVFGLQKQSCRLWEGTMRDNIILSLLIIYVLGCIISFGHSANYAMRHNDVLAVLNASFIGTTWPLYASYIYFRQHGDE